MTFKAMIVDDGSQDFAIIENFFENSFPKVNLIKIDECPIEVIDELSDLCPDILILDMDSDKIKLSEALEQRSENTQTIFVSSNTNRAFDAFNYGAAGFLLKPIEVEVLNLTLRKVLYQLECNKKSWDNYRDLNLLVIPSLEHHDIINLEKVLFIKADGRCTNFYTVDEKSYLSYKNLSEYNTLITSYSFFVKINRSTIININFLKKIIKDSGLHCQLEDGTLIPVSRRKVAEFKNFLSTFE